MRQTLKKINNKENPGLLPLTWAHAGEIHSVQSKSINSKYLAETELIDRFVQNILRSNETKLSVFQSFKSLPTLDRRFQHFLNISMSGNLIYITVIKSQLMLNNYENKWNMIWTKLLR